MKTVSKIAGTMLLLACILSLGHTAGAASFRPPGDSLIAVRTRLLTAQSWEYYEYYKDFNVGKTTLLWKMTRNRNVQDMSFCTMEFFADNAYQEITIDNDTLKGTWKLTENGNKVEVVKPAGKLTMEIKQLDKQVFNWYTDNGGYYGAMRVQVPGIEKDESIFVMLTSDIWMYEAYFNDYSGQAPKLVWHINKRHSDNDMSKSRLQFLSNGKFNEMNENGETTSGKWRLINDNTQLEMVTEGGTMTVSDITVLTKRKFEFNRVEKNHYYYGEMIHAD